MVAESASPVVEPREPVPQSRATSRHGRTLYESLQVGNQAFQGERHSADTAGLRHEKYMNQEPNSEAAETVQTTSVPAVDLPRLVRLEYEGKPWTAERLKTSSYVHFKNAANPNDGMMWAVPDENMGNLAWRIYHANYTPTREELFGMLSVIDSYRSLLAKPAKRQRTLARALLQFILPNSQAQE